MSSTLFEHVLCLMFGFEACFCANWCCSFPALEIYYDEYDPLNHQGTFKAISFSF